MNTLSTNVFAMDEENEQELEEIVEVEPEIVYFTEESDSNIALVDADNEDDENSIQPECSDGEIMPVMPFDLSSSYIYLIGDTDVEIEQCDADSNGETTYENEYVEEDEEEQQQEEEEEDEESDQNSEFVGTNIPFCEVCRVNFSDSRELKTHYENCHVKLKQSIYCCSICKKSFPTLELLQAHDQRNCSDRRKIQCNKCGAEFASTYLFSHHFKIEHEKKLVCVVCQKVHTSEAALMHHLQIHDSESNYSCEKCNVKCENIYELISHNKTHSKALLYACNKCDAAFSMVPELAFHIRQQHGKTRRPAETVK